MRRDHRRRRDRGSERKETDPVLFRAVVLAPTVDLFGPAERAAWHAAYTNRLVGPYTTTADAEARCLQGEPALVRAVSSGDERKPGILAPPTERRGTEVWFTHKRHRVVFVVDTSPSMRTLRGSSAFPPLSTVGAALVDCFQGLARPMGSLRQEVFVSVVALVHTQIRPSASAASSGAASEGSKSGIGLSNSSSASSSNSSASESGRGRDSVVELVQGFLLTGRNRESARASADALAGVVTAALGQLEDALWGLVSGQQPNRHNYHTGRSTAASSGSRFQGGDADEALAVVAPPASLEPMIEAGVFALKWLPSDAVPAIFLVTDGVCRDKQLLTTYDGMIMQLCRRDISLHVLLLGSDAASGPGAARKGGVALGMVADTDTIGRLCEMTGGSSYSPKLLKSLTRIPATLLHGAAGDSFGSGSLGSLGSGGGGSHGRLSFDSGSIGSSGLQRTSSFGAGSTNSNLSLGLPHLSATLSGQGDGLMPSAFQQALFFRLSPLSGAQSSASAAAAAASPLQMLSMSGGGSLSSGNGSSNDSEFRVLLGRKAVARYRLGSCILARLVDMRNSEGFHLTEVRFQTQLNNGVNQGMPAARGSSTSVPGSATSNSNGNNSRGFHNSACTLSWSMRWQTDVLLKYTVEYTPTTTPATSAATPTRPSSQGAGLTGSAAAATAQVASRVAMGTCDVFIDVVCNGDFMAKLDRAVANDHEGGGAVAERPRDRLFNDPSAQLRHFAKVLRDVDALLVHLCALVQPAETSTTTAKSSAHTFLLPTRLMHAPAAAPQRSRFFKSSASTAVFQNQASLLTSLGGNKESAGKVAPAARYKVLSQLSVRDWHRWFTVNYFEVSRVYGEDDGGANSMRGKGVSIGNSSGSSSIDSRSRLVGALRAWCRSQRSSGSSCGRALSAQLFLRHVSDVASAASGTIGKGSGRVESTKEEAAATLMTGFCLVKLNWAAHGGFASIHLGFFNISARARLAITQELQAALMQSSNRSSELKQGKNEAYVVTKGTLAAKMVDWSGLIKEDPMDASGRDDKDAVALMASKTVSTSAAVEQHARTSAPRSSLSKSSSFRASATVTTSTAAAPATPPAATDEELASGGALMSLTSYLRSHRWHWRISPRIGALGSDSGAGLLLLETLAKRRRAEGFTLVHPLGKGLSDENGDESAHLDGIAGHSSAMGGAPLGRGLYMVRQVQVKQFYSLGATRNSGGGMNYSSSGRGNSGASRSSSMGALTGPNSIFGSLDPETGAVKPPAPEPAANQASNADVASSLPAVLQYRAELVADGRGGVAVATGLWMDPQWGFVSDDDAAPLLQAELSSGEHLKSMAAKILRTTPGVAPTGHASCNDFFVALTAAVGASDRRALVSMHAFLYAYGAATDAWPLPSSAHRATVVVAKTGAKKESSCHGGGGGKCNSVWCDGQGDAEAVPLLSLEALIACAERKTISLHLFSVPDKKTSPNAQEKAASFSPPASASGSVVSGAGTDTSAFADKIGTSASVDNDSSTFVPDASYVRDERSNSQSEENGNNNFADSAERELQDAAAALEAAAQAQGESALRKANGRLHDLFLAAARGAYSHAELARPPSEGHWLVKVVGNGAMVLAHVPPKAAWCKSGCSSDSPRVVIELFTITMSMIHRDMAIATPKVGTANKQDPPPSGFCSPASEGAAVASEGLLVAHAQSFAVSLAEALRQGAVLRPMDLAWTLGGSSVGPGILGPGLVEAKSEIDVSQLARMCFPRETSKGSTTAEQERSESSNDGSGSSFSRSNSNGSSSSNRGTSLNRDHAVTDEVLWNDDEWHESMARFFRPLVTPEGHAEWQLYTGPDEGPLTGLQSDSTSTDGIGTFNSTSSAVVSSAGRWRSDNMARPRAGSLGDDTTVALRKPPRGFRFSRSSSGQMLAFWDVATALEPPLFVRFECATAIDPRTDNNRSDSNENGGGIDSGSGSDSEFATKVHDVTSESVNQFSATLAVDSDVGLAKACRLLMARFHHQLTATGKFAVPQSSSINGSDEEGILGSSSGGSISSRTKNAKITEISSTQVEKVLSRIHTTLVVVTSSFKPAVLETARTAEARIVPGSLMDDVPLSSILEGTSNRYGASAASTNAPSAATFTKRGSINASSPLSHPRALPYAQQPRVPKAYRGVIDWLDRGVNEMQASQTLSDLLCRASNSSNSNNYGSFISGTRGLSLPLLTQVQHELPLVTANRKAAFPVALRFVCPPIVTDDLKEQQWDRTSLRTAASGVSNARFSDFSGYRMPQAVVSRLEQELLSKEFLDLRLVGDTFVLVESSTGDNSGDSTSASHDADVDEYHVPYWALIKIQSESGVYQGPAQSNSHSSSSKNSGSDGDHTLGFGCLEHSVTVELHHPRIQDLDTAAAERAALQLRLRWGLAAACHRVNQRLLLVDLEKSKMASTLLIPQVPSFADDTTGAGTASLAVATTLPSTTAPVASRTEAYFQDLEFSCKEQFSHTFALMPRLSAPEALKMLARTKELGNLMVSNRPHTFVYSTPSKDRVYHTCYFTLRPSSQRPFVQTTGSDTTHPSLVESGLSQTPGAACLDLTVCALSPVQPEISAKLCDIVAQHLFDYAITRLATGLRRNPSQLLDDNDLLYIAGIPPPPPPSRSVASYDSISVNAPNDASSAVASSTVEEVNFIADEEPNHSEPDGPPPRVAKISVVEDSSSSSTESTDSKLVSAAVGASRKMQVAVSLPGVSDPWVYVLLLRHLLVRGGNEHAALVLPVTRPEPMTTTTVPSKITKPRAGSVFSGLPLSPRLARMPRVSLADEKSLPPSPGEATGISSNRASSATKDASLEAPKGQFAFPNRVVSHSSSSPVARSLWTPPRRFNSLTLPQPRLGRVRSESADVNVSNDDAVRATRTFTDPSGNLMQEPTRRRAQSSSVMPLEPITFKGRETCAPELEPTAASNKDGDWINFGEADDLALGTWVDVTGQTFYYRSDSKGPDCGRGLALLNLSLLPPATDAPVSRVRTCSPSNAATKDNPASEALPAVGCGLEMSVQPWHHDTGPDFCKGNPSKGAVDKETDAAVLSDLPAEGWRVGITLSTSSRSGVSLDALLQLALGHFKQALREYHLEAILRQPLPLFKQIASIPESIVTKKTTASVEHNDAVNANGSKLSPSFASSSSSAPVQAFPDLSSTRAVALEHDDETHGATSVSAAALVWLLEGGGAGEELEENGHAQRRVRSHRRSHRLGHSALAAATAGASSSESGTGASSSGRELFPSGGSGGGSGQRNVAFARTARQEELPHWLVGPLLADLVTNAVPSLATSEEIAIFRHSKPFRRDSTVESKRGGDSVAAAFPFEQCALAEAFDDNSFNSCRAPAHRGSSGSSCGREGFSEEVRSADYVLVFGCSGSAWGKSDLMFPVLGTSDCTLPMPQQLPASEAHASTQGNYVKTRSTAAAEALTTVAERRAVAVVCVGARGVSLATYNLELDRGLAPALAHAVDAAIARGALRRRALLRLLLPPLLPLPLQRRYDERNKSSISSAHLGGKVAIGDLGSSSALVLSAPVLAAEPSSVRDAGFNALSQLLPELKPALAAAARLPKVLLAPSSDGHPGLAVTKTGTLELFVGCHPCTLDSGDDNVGPDSFDRDSGSASAATPTSSVVTGSGAPDSSSRVRRKDRRFGSSAVAATSSGAADEAMYGSTSTTKGDGAAVDSRSSDSAHLAAGASSATTTTLSAPPRRSTTAGVTDPLQIAKIAAAGRRSKRQMPPQMLKANPPRHLVRAPPQPTLTPLQPPQGGGSASATTARIVESTPEPPSPPSLTPDTLVPFPSPTPSTAAPRGSEEAPLQPFPGASPLPFVPTPIDDASQARNRNASNAASATNGALPASSPPTQTSSSGSSLTRRRSSSFYDYASGEANAPSQHGAETNDNAVAAGATDENRGNTSHDDKSRASRGSPTSSTSVLPAASHVVSFESVPLPWDPLLQLGPAARLRLKHVRQQQSSSSNHESGNDQDDVSKVAESTLRSPDRETLSPAPLFPPALASSLALLEPGQKIPPAGARGTLARLGMEAASAALLSASLQLETMRAQRLANDLAQTLTAAAITRKDGDESPKSTEPQLTIVTWADVQQMVKQLSPVESACAALVDTRVLAACHHDTPLRTTTKQRSQDSPLSAKAVSAGASDAEFSIVDAKSKAKIEVFDRSGGEATLSSDGVLGVYASHALGALKGREISVQSSTPPCASTVASSEDSHMTRWFVLPLAPLPAADPAASDDSQTTTTTEVVATDESAARLFAYLKRHRVSAPSTHSDPSSPVPVRLPAPSAVIASSPSPQVSPLPKAPLSSISKACDREQPGGVLLVRLTAKPKVDSLDTSSTSLWEAKVGIGRWAPYAPEVQAQLALARAAGEHEVCGVRLESGSYTLRLTALEQVGLNFVETLREKMLTYS